MEDHILIALLGAPTSRACMMCCLAYWGHRITKSNNKCSQNAGRVLCKVASLTIGLNESCWTSFPLQSNPTGEATMNAENVLAPLQVLLELVSLAVEESGAGETRPCGGGVVWQGNQVPQQDHLKGCSVAGAF